jgi:predicted transposase/invertase (TIGR01784 family)
MLSKFLDPKNDFAFKKIFGSEKNQDILISFLNDVLLFTGKLPIVSVTFLPTIQDAETASKKTSIIDVLCKDEKGCTYIVEMQVAKSKGFEKRAQYYASKAYSSQAKKGGQYQDLKEVIFLAIADYDMFPEKKAYKSDHVILDRVTYEQDLKDFSFTFIELPKFNIPLDKLSSLQEKWCYFFKYADETSPQDLKELIKNNPALAKAYEELDKAYWSDLELNSYEAAEKRAKDYISSLEQKFDEGLEKGKAEGLEKGKAEGIAQSKREVAVEMILDGELEPKIIKYTGLTSNEIAEIKKSLP